MLRELSLIVGLIGLPIAYLFLCRQMARESADAPKAPFFFIFGAAGGYLVLYGVGPSFLSFMVGGPFLAGAFITLAIVLVRTLRKRPRTRFHRAASIASTVLLLGIGMVPFTGNFGGLLHAGHWEEDPENWSRAFAGMPVPPGVRVIHSLVTRSPHFTYEGSYFFEFTAPDDFMEAWKSQYQLVPMDPRESALVPSVEQPAWYMPKPIQRYEIWGSRRDDYAIFRDPETGSWFVSESQ
jgi:hypothetical protein